MVDQKVIQLQHKRNTMVDQKVNQRQLEIRRRRGQLEFFQGEIDDLLTGAE